MHITTAYHGATNTTGARITARASTGGSASIPYPYELSGEAVHRAAVARWRERHGQSAPACYTITANRRGNGYRYTRAPLDTKPHPSPTGYVETATFPA